MKQVFQFKSHETQHICFYIFKDHLHTLSTYITSSILTLQMIQANICGFLMFGVFLICVLSAHQSMKNLKCHHLLISADCKRVTNSATCHISSHPSCSSSFYILTHCLQTNRAGFLQIKWKQHNQSQLQSFH